MLAAVATDKGSSSADWTPEESLFELEQLVKTAGGTVIGRMIQHMAQPHKSTYLGKGKLEELANSRSDIEYDTVVFDDELSPLQQKTIEDELKVKVIDRVALILDIFARHARTREGQLQVELAQMQYLLPRLAGQWSHLERLGGGIGTRGPGESQLESDKRILQRKIVLLKAKLKDISRQRDLYRQKRKSEGVPVVALIGYTNSGKSSLMRAMTKADVLVEDKLFATLDPTTRRMSLPGNQQVLVTDTVGFIKKLPPTIINAFKATLEELADAAVLIHIVDITSKNAVGQCQTVENILKDLKLDQKPRLTVFNKIDLLSEASDAKDEKTALESLKDFSDCQPSTAVFTSATRRWGLRDLSETIGRYLPGTWNLE
jgi:GTP-binding protein HflX